MVSTCFSGGSCGAGSAGASLIYIKNNGISFSTEIEATFADGTVVSQPIAVDIPAGTEIRIGGEVPTEPITLAAAPLEVDEIPPPPENEMPMGAVLFEPQDATFDKPVSIKVPIEIKLPEGLQIPLKKFKNGVWETIGTATIDESGLGADADVTEFGQLAVQPQVSIETTSSEPEKGEPETTEIPQDQTTIEVEVSETVSFPGGLPEGVTVEYATALIQKVKGISLGTTTIVIELPEVETVASKPASPLSTSKIEPWINRCELVQILETTNETIELTITFDDGSTIIFPIVYL